MMLESYMINNQFDIIKKLIDSCPEYVITSNSEGLFPIHITCKGNNIDIVKYLVDIWPESLRIPTNDGLYPLHIACMGDNLEIIKYLIELWPECLSICANKGLYPFHLACIRGNIEIIKYLVDYGVDITAVNEMNENCLDLAMMNNHFHVIEYLLTLDDKKLKKILQDKMKIKWH